MAEKDDSGSWAQAAADEAKGWGEAAANEAKGWGEAIAEFFTGPQETPSAPPSTDERIASALEEIARNSRNE